jgi:hypothetical protein
MFRTKVVEENIFQAQYNFFRNVCGFRIIEGIFTGSSHHSRNTIYNCRTVEPFLIKCYKGGPCLYVPVPFALFIRGHPQLPFAN